jgi:hypothetical protein
MSKSHATIALVFALGCRGSSPASAPNNRSTPTAPAPTCEALAASNEPVRGLRATLVPGGGHATSINPGLNSASSLYEIDGSLADATELYQRCFGEPTVSARNGLVFAVPPRNGEPGTTSVELFATPGHVMAMVQCERCY